LAARKDHEELVVITKTYDLILWSCHHTGKFPRHHRFVLGERIERNLYDLLETLIRAKYSKPRQELLEKANLMLELVGGWLKSSGREQRHLRGGVGHPRGRPGGGEETRLAGGPDPPSPFRQPPLPA
jgi:hypothetical protein